MNPAQRVAAVLAGSTAAIALLSTWEGWRPVGYLDLAGIPTACYGHTGPESVVGRRYSEGECASLLAQDAVRHGLEIDACIAVPISVPTRAAFTSFAYNVGSKAFCSSTLAKRLNAGDRAGACAELSRWVRVKGATVQGLANRRKAERQLCEQGLTS